MPDSASPFETVARPRGPAELAMQHALLDGARITYYVTNEFAGMGVYNAIAEGEMELRVHKHEAAQARELLRDLS